jgi:hypothetical protein
VVELEIEELEELEVEELKELEVLVGAELDAEGLAVVLLEIAPRLLYICKAFEPPQYSSAFPLQVMIQAVDPTTLPA